MPSATAKSLLKSYLNQQSLKLCVIVHAGMLPAFISSSCYLASSERATLCCDMDKQQACPSFCPTIRRQHPLSATIKPVAWLKHNQSEAHPILQVWLALLADKHKCKASNRTSQRGHRTTCAVTQSHPVIQSPSQPVKMGQSCLDFPKPSRVELLSARTIRT